jgi:uncharacterized membrane protein YsdA (DUF1294 family)
MLAALAIYLTLANLAAFAAFGLDKRRAARGGRRIAEARLLALAAAGGGPGAAVGQRLFRHKTRKQPFAARLRLILTLQAVAAIAALALRP